MHIPARILRDHVQPFTKSRRPDGVLDLEKRETYLDAAQSVFADFGRPAITLKNLADALYISTATLRRHFADMDQLVADIIIRHLNKLTKLLGDIQANTPDGFARRRAAYYANTRGPNGGLNDAHAVTLRDRHTLPADLVEGIEHLRLAIGIALAGANGNEALALLDSPQADPAKIEIVMQALGEPIPEATIQLVQRRIAAPVRPAKPSPDATPLTCTYSPGSRALDKLFETKPRAQNPRYPPDDD